MSLKIYIFATEGEAKKCAEGLGGRAKVIYRGDYRHDWLVTVDN